VPVARTVHGSLDFTITEVGGERVVADMPIADGMRNPYGVVNAGAILWFADVAATVLVLGERKPSAGMAGFPLAIHLGAHFLGNQAEGAFRAVSTYVRRGRTVSVVRTLVTGRDERLVADVTTSHVLAKGDAGRGSPA
jgi:uncharacterized protein (TIGR00369 family)